MNRAFEDKAAKKRKGPSLRAGRPRKRFNKSPTNYFGVLREGPLSAPPQPGISKLRLARSRQGC